MPGRSPTFSLVKLGGKYPQAVRSRPLAPDAQAGQAKLFSSGSSAAHLGHSDGAHMALLSTSTRSKGRSRRVGPDAGDDARTSSAPAITGSAPQARRSAMVPRTAEPALTTSSTTAKRRPRAAPLSIAGRRYPTV